jgi:hypothetical protein
MSEWGSCKRVLLETEYERGDQRQATYVEDRESLSLAGVGVLLAQGDQLLGQTLGLLCLGPCCGYRLVFEEGCDEVSKQSLTVRAAARQMSVFLKSACHDFSLLSFPAGVALWVSRELCRSSG